MNRKDCMLLLSVVVSDENNEANQGIFFPQNTLNTTKITHLCYGSLKKKCHYCREKQISLFSLLPKDKLNVSG